MFAYTCKLTGIPQTTFCILLVLALVSFGWLHGVVWHILHQAAPPLNHHKS